MWFGALRYDNDFGARLPVERRYKMGRVVEFEPTEEQFGVFWKYLVDENVTGINYNGEQLWITDLKKGRYEVKEKITEKFLHQFVNLIANCVNKQFNSANPVLEADTRELRICILHESVAKSGISISIRKSPPVVRNTIQTMIKSGYCSKEMVHFLANCVRVKTNFVFCGKPEVGKTEGVKFFMQFIPANERVITIEDSLELHYGDINPGHDYVELQIGRNFDYRQAIKASLRQDADWLVLSEARSSEVEALLESWSTGVCGFTTIHLGDLHNLPDRIQNMMDNKEDAVRMENRVYEHVDVGVLIRMQKGKGEIKRYIDQICLYCRENGENKIYILVEDGKLVSRELPEEMQRKFARAGICDPFYCDDIKEWEKCGI